jgi:hypothetical protein
MSFINWGSESPEQIAIRRRLEEQAVYEQAARMAQARQKAGNAQAGVGGGTLNEFLPSYCGGNKLIVTSTRFMVDLLKPKVNYFIPSAADFDTYVTEEEDPLETATRAYRDAYVKAEYDNLISEFFYKMEPTSELPSPVPPASKLNKIDLPISSPTSWFCKEVSKYEEWTTSGAAEEMSEVIELNTRTAVATTEDLPSTGNSGDIIWVIELGEWYAWNKNSNDWETAYYNTYIEPTHSIMALRRDYYIKAKNEVCLAATPFLYASKYIPEFRIKKDKL